MERPTFPPYAHMEREGQFFHDFYGKVKDKLKRLFEENERDEELCNLIPDSQFVKIYYDRDKYYSVGLVRENGSPVTCIRPAGEGERAARGVRGALQVVSQGHRKPRGRGLLDIVSKPLRRQLHKGALKAPMRRCR